VNDPGGRRARQRPSAVVDQARITAFEVFAGLPPAELDELANVITEVDVEAGAPVVTHGDFGYVLYAIETGVADVVVDGERTGRTLGPGDTFGEIALLVTGRRTATIVARTDLRLLSLRRLGGERLAR
jgi:CRP-like cAMP-binding protein